MILLKDVINLPKKNLNSNLNWIKYKFNSCRYDSFFFNYSNIIINLINKTNSSDNIICFNNISKKLLEISENEKDLGFWEILEKYNLDNIGLLNDINNPKFFDSINSVYSFLNNNDDFCLKYNLKRTCDLCNFKLEKNEYFNAYISFTKNDFKLYNSLENKIK